jgi:hypothetical protein
MRLLLERIDDGETGKDRNERERGRSCAATATGPDVLRGSLGRNF